jgi:polysaccharide biosynthesis PFTS motif protein
MIKFIYIAVQINNSKVPECSYVVFLDLLQNNLPGYDGGKKTRDMITWYKESNIRKPAVKKMWAQARVESNYNPPDDLIVSRLIFPRFSSFTACLNYYSIILSAFVVSLIGMLRGRWWYGFIITESISLHYVNNLKREHLAEEYFFNNSSWFYKPMWTYEVENGKSLITQVFYSTNQDYIVFNDYKFTETYFYQLMKWERFIVWDQQQKNNLKQFCPNSEYILARYIDITGKKWEYFSENKEKILSIFDVTPRRPTNYTKLGFSIPLYYSE